MIKIKKTEIKNTNYEKRLIDFATKSRQGEQRRNSLSQEVRFR